MFWAKLIFIMAILAAAVAGVAAYNNAIEHAAVLEQQLQEVKAERDAANVALAEEKKETARVQGLLDESDRLAAERAKEVEREKQVNAKLGRDLAALAERDKLAEKWLNGPVPDSVRSLRRGAGADSENGVRGTPGVPGPDSKPKPDAGTPHAGSDGGRTADGSDEPAVRPAILQCGQAGCEDLNRKEPQMKKLIFAALVTVFVSDAVVPASAAEAALEAAPHVISAETNYYDTISAIGTSTADNETKRLAIFAATIARVQEKSGGGSAQPQQINVQAQRTGWDYLFGTIGSIFSSAKDVTMAVAPAYLAYKGQIKNSDSSVRIAEVNRDVSIAQSNNFLALGTAGINGTSTTAGLGFNAMARQPTGTTITNNINNSNGVNTGAGNLLYAPITNSYNPITNPVSRVCATSATGTVTCSP